VVRAQPAEDGGSRNGRGDIAEGVFNSPPQPRVDRCVLAIKGAYSGT
jgi:hypothetical protein